MVKRLSEIASRFSRFLAILTRNQRGSVLVLWAFAAVPVVLGVGTVVDVSRAYMARSRLAFALDAAGLAAGAAGSTVRGKCLRAAESVSSSAAEQQQEQQQPVAAPAAEEEATAAQAGSCEGEACPSDADAVLREQQEGAEEEAREEPQEEEAGGGPVRRPSARRAVDLGFLRSRR